MRSGMFNDRGLALWRMWFPPVPAALRDSLTAFQLANIHRQIPILHLLALTNLALVDYVLWHQGVPLRFYGWTAGVAAFCLWRILLWQRRNARGVGAGDTARFLRGANIAATGSVAVVSAFSVLSFVQGLGFPLLIPVSLAFGTFSIAHCLAPLRFASIATLLIGILPSGIAMLASGDFMAMALGGSMSSVALLKIGFLRDYHRQTIAMLALHRQVETLAHSDALTGLANRHAICAAIEDALAEAGRSGEPVTVALIDLDGFKQINDTHGHHVGDALLKIVAERLTAHAGPGAMAGRLGGDEFVLMLRGEAGGLSIDARLTSIVLRLCQPAQIGALTLPVSGSLGFATYPAGGLDLDGLLQAADEALYAAKRSGKGRAMGQAAVLRVA